MNLSLTTDAAEEDEQSRERGEHELERKGREYGERFDF